MADREVHALVGNLVATEAPDIMAATLRLRTHFAVPHLLAGARFSREVRDVEKANQGQPFGDFYEPIRAASIACVLTSVAGLESYINEIFVDGSQLFPTVRPDVLMDIWKMAESASILDKYDLALVLRNGTAIDKGSRPYQPVKALVRLRNALVHFKPEWDDEKEEHAKLSRQLAQYIQPSPWLAADPGVFPRAWASHSCTSWTVQTAVEFIELFERNAGLPSRLADFHDRIQA